MDARWITLSFCLASVSVSICWADCSGGATQLEAKIRPRELQSPNYPNDYPPNQSCKWTIYGFYHETDIIVSVLELDIEDSQDCSNDSLVIQGYDSDDAHIRLCGSMRPNQSLDIGGAANIIFFTNGQGSGKGFRLQYNLQYRPNEDDDDYKKRGYSQGWGILILVVLVVTAIVTVIAIILGCYCKRRQVRNSNRQKAFDLVTTVSGNGTSSDEKYAHYPDKSENI